MTISHVSYSNTFAHWLIATNSVVDDVNLLKEGNYTKSKGTLFINTANTGIDSESILDLKNQVNIFGANGVLTVVNPSYFQNTINITTGTNSIFANGTVKIEGVLSTNNNVSFIANNSTSTLKLTQKGAGNSLEVYNAALATTPFSVSATGNVSAPIFFSTANQGSTPLVVKSTTVVANLNSNFLGGNTASYFTNASNMSSGLLSPTYGGTGISNIGKTITLGGNINTSNNFNTTGNFPITINAVANSVITLPPGANTLVGSGYISNVDISATAAIVDTKLATISTSGKVSNSATTANSANGSSTIVSRDSTGDFTTRRITLSAAQGTSPLAVTSTTQVNNLNSQYLNGYSVGTSGGSIPLLNATNIWSGPQSFITNPTYFGDSTSNSNIEVATGSYNNPILDFHSSNSVADYNARIQCTGGSSASGSGSLSVIAANMTITGNTAVVGNLSVTGDTIISGSSITNSDTFTLRAASGEITSPNSAFIVKRNISTPTSNNATIQWNNTENLWKVNDVSTNTFYSLLSTQNIGTSGTKIPYLNGTNIWNNPQTFYGGISANTVHINTNLNITDSFGTTRTDISFNSGLRIWNKDNTPLVLGTSNITQITIEANGHTIFANTISVPLVISTSNVSASRLISTIAQGTAPLIVTSNTQVSNLNSQLLNGYSVGTSGATIPLLNSINTWSAKQIFSGTNVEFPAGSSTLPAISYGSTAGVYFPAANTVAISTSSVERLRIDASGNASIGTSINSVADYVGAARAFVIQSPSSDTRGVGYSTNSLTISNSDTTANNASQINFAANTGASSQFSSAWIGAIHGPRTSGAYPYGQLVFGTSTYTNWAPSEKMRITNTGTVSIGSSTPDTTKKLYVNGDSQVIGDISATTVTATVAQGTAPLIVTSNTQINNLNSQLLNGRSIGTSGNTIPVLNAINTWSNTQTISVNSSSDAVTITQSGTGKALSITGNTNIAGTLNLTENNANSRTRLSFDTTNGLIIRNLDNTSLHLGTNNQDILRFDSVSASVKSTFLGTNVEFPAGSSTLPAISYGSTAGVYFPAANTVAISTSSVERLRIDASGNASIGTSINSVADYVGAARAFVIQSPSSDTRGVGYSTNSLTISNSDTTANNASQINFAANTGASSQFSSAWIGAIHGPRTSGAYPYGQLVFGTSTYTNWAPSEKMRITNTGTVSIGSSTPDTTKKLYVNGDTRLFGSTTANNITLVDAGSATSPSIAFSPTAGIYGSGNTVFISTASIERVQINQYGNIGIGATPTAGIRALVYPPTSPIAGFTSQFGFNVSGTIQSSTTSVWTSFLSSTTTAAAAFTLGSYKHFHADAITKGSESAITNEYGFYGGVTSGTGKYNLYMNGDADNYISGKLGIGATPTNKLDVVGTSSGGSVVARICNNADTVNSQVILSLDCRGDGVNVRDSQIRATRLAGSGTSSLEFYTANDGDPAKRLDIDNTGAAVFSSTISATNIAASGSLSATLNSTNPGVSITQSGSGNGITVSKSSSGIGFYSSGTAPGPIEIGKTGNQSNVAIGMSSVGGNIELKGPATTGNPFIDFATANTDYDVRLALTPNSGVAGTLGAGTLAIGAGNITTGADFLSSASILSSNKQKGIGHAVGTSLVATQGSNKTTLVTINSVVGTITTASSTLQGGSANTFIFNNAGIAANDNIILNTISGTIGAYNVGLGSIGTGTCNVFIRNLTTGPLSEAVQIRYTVLKQ